jgi:hypothetical protein
MLLNCHLSCSPAASSTAVSTILETAQLLCSVAAALACRYSTARNPDPLAVLGPDWCTELSVVAQCLEDLGLSAASEEAYTRVINR